MLDETWKEYPLNSNYLVSDLGNVFSKKSRKILKVDYSENYSKSYPRVTLYNKGIRERKSVHRMVAETFIPNDNKHFTQVNHIDGDKRNPCMLNLEWCSQEQNMQHAVANGLHKSKRSKIKATIRETNELLVFDSWTSFFKSPKIKMGYRTAKKGGNSLISVEVIDYVG